LQINVKCKDASLFYQECREPEKRHAGKCYQGKGCYGETVGLIGAGQIGRKLIELLKPFQLRVLVVDPYLSDENAKALGVEKVAMSRIPSRP
jgi:phosphoglycerate dehydrogenase-like enzyme